MFAPTNYYTPITSCTDTDLVLMKEYLNNDHLLTFSTDFNKFCTKELSGQNDPSLNGQTIVTGQYDINDEYDGHSMTIVGYNDNIWYDLNQDGYPQAYEKGAFKVANSHSPRYCNNGFVWVMYDALNYRSNYNAINNSLRRALITEYTYYVIEVEKYDLDLTAEITLKHKNRNEIVLQTHRHYGYSNGSFGSFLNRNGGFHNFAGYDGYYSQATFAFDFNLDNPLFNRTNLAISIRDDNYSAENIPTKVCSIKYIDKTGKIVVDESIQIDVLNNIQLFSYKIGMVGDIDNDASLSIMDVSKINYHVAEMQILADNDLLVADTDGDGDVTIMDATHLQRYLANLISQMDNGMYVQLT